MKNCGFYVNPKLVPNWSQIEKLFKWREYSLKFERGVDPDVIRKLEEI